MARWRRIAQRVRALAVEPDVRAVRVQACPEPPLPSRRANRGDRRQTHGGDRSGRAHPRRWRISARVACRRRRGQTPARRTADRCLGTTRSGEASSTSITRANATPLPERSMATRTAHPECRHSPGQHVHRAEPAIDRQRPASPTSATNVSSAIEAHLGQGEMAACEFTEEGLLGIAERRGRHLRPVGREFGPYLLEQFQASRLRHARPGRLRHRVFNRDEAIDDGGACLTTRAARRIEARVDIADGRRTRVDQRRRQFARRATADSRTSTRSRCFDSERQPCSARTSPATADDGVARLVAAPRTPPRGATGRPRLEHRPRRTRCARAGGEGPSR